jgi:methyl-accepting chemotaxis protein
MRLSLAKKLIFGGSIMVALPIMILGWYAYDTASTGITTQARESAETVAERVADIADTFLRQEITLAENIASNNTVQALVKKLAETGESGAGLEMAAADKELQAFGAKDAASGYEAVVVIGMNGVVVGNSLKTDKKLDLAGRRYFQEAKQGKISADQVVMSKVTGNPVVTMGVPIKDNTSGKVLGVVGLVIDTTWLAKKISGFKVGETGYAWMVNQDGFFVAHPEAATILKENIKNMAGMEEISSKMLAGQSDVITYDYKGVGKTCGFAPVKLNGWSVAFTQDTSEFMAAANSIRNGVALIGVISLGLAVFLVILVARSITRPISRVAGGLRDASDQVSSASFEVANSSQQLAEGASEQAASIEETSASLEEITSMTRQNADNAKQADSLTKEANEVVEQAKSVMTQLTGSMEEISSASDETSKIIKTIDEIAFQTNLLALNAAVEAARAGEAGAGFAVVADEVRSLAMRAAEAAKNTQGLIENTVDKVHTGGQLVSQADKAFRKVAESTGKVAELVGEISAASDEQAQGVDQISKAITEMEKVTQAVAATAEESAAASEEMAAQAESMHEFVSELMGVVDGKGGKVSRKAKQPLTKQERRERSLLPPPGKSSGAGNQAAGAGNKPSKGGKPDEVIPLGDDDFRDF